MSAACGTGNVRMLRLLTRLGAARPTSTIPMHPRARAYFEVGGFAAIHARGADGMLSPRWSHCRRSKVGPPRCVWYFCAATCARGRDCPASERPVAQLRQHQARLLWWWVRTLHVVLPWMQKHLPSTQQRPYRQRLCLRHSCMRRSGGPQVTCGLCRARQQSTYAAI